MVFISFKIEFVFSTVALEARISFAQDPKEGDLRDKLCLLTRSTLEGMGSDCAITGAGEEMFGCIAAGDLEPCLEGEHGLTVSGVGAGGLVLMFSACFTGVRGMIPLQNSFLFNYFLL